MNLAIAATVFGLVAVAELPDKTMIASIVMGSRGRPAPVWAGATVAFALQALLAVIAGRFLSLVPHRALETIVTVIFGLGAIYLLFVPEKSQRAKGAKEAGSHGAETPSWRIAISAFVVMAVGEMGDLTQLLMVNLEAKYRSTVSVFVGGFVALTAVSALGTFGGRALIRFVPLGVIRRLGGVALLGFCAYGIFELAS
ncbi:MAG: TMEM165/GDT1 family protein [Acidimicrobiales bacterium]